MLTKTEQLQRTVKEYQREGHKLPASAEEIAEWAVESGRYNLTAPTLKRLCARDLAHAMSLEYFVDSTGRRVRAKHPARVARDGRQLIMWDDIRTASRDHMEVSFQMRRRRITYGCKQMKTDVESYNGAHPEEPPIQMILDFSKDVAEMELSEPAYSSSNSPTENTEQVAANELEQPKQASDIIIETR